MRMNLVVLRVADLERSRELYESLGLNFALERHGKGPEHLAAELNGVVFELYHQTGSPTSSSSAGARIGGFALGEIKAVVTRWLELGVGILVHLRYTRWGWRVVVEDFDGHRIEILSDG